MIRKNRGWLLVIVACSLVVFVLGSFKYRQVQAAIAAGAAYPEPSETVETAVAHTSKWRQRISVLGEVVARRATQLKSESSGRVERVGFRPGERVNVGQLLVQLDMRQEMAQHEAASAEVTLAELRLNRQRKLVETGVASTESLDRSKAEFTAAAASVAALDALLAKKQIVAPFTAMAGLHQLDIADYLHAGEVITDLVEVDSHVWVDFSLPQNWSSVEVGDRVLVMTTAGEVGDSDNSISALIIAIDPQVDARSRQRRLRAEVENANGILMSGSTVQVEVFVGDARSVVLIPGHAVRYGPLGPNVFILEEAESDALAAFRAVKRAVVLGPQSGTQRVVISGLQEGERVATLGAFKLREGILVHSVKPGSEGDTASLQEMSM